MTKDLFDIYDRIVIVTGGMGRLGRQFTLALSRRGARVAIFDLDVRKKRISERFGKELDKRRLLFASVDVTKKASVEAGLRLVVDQWGVPDALINNAAIDVPPDSPAEENGPFEAYPEASWDRMMEVNAKGVFLCSQVVGGRMAEAGRGSIVNISSVYGLVSPDQRVYEYRRKGATGFYKPVSYSASKAMLVNLTRYLATYWASRNVRVNTLTLGGVWDHQDEEFVRRYCERVPLGRMAREDDYNGAVIFLISDASLYMTGANLVMDGGWTAW